MNIIMIEESKLNQIMSMLKNINIKLGSEDEKEAYGIGEVAKMKNISYQTAMAKVHTGEWKAVDEGTRKRPTYRIYKDELNRIMNRKVS